METFAVTRTEIEEVAIAALVAHGATPANARPVGRAMALAEAEGNTVCGLFYLPHFCAHLTSGKVDGRAVPQVTGTGGVVCVDAAMGFAHAAYEAGLPALLAAVAKQGVAAMSIAQSYNALALGHFVRPLAEHGLVALALSNAPASVAPPGAQAPIFGTNPLAWAAPLAGGPPVVVDQSMSAVTKTAILLRQATGQALEPGWGQDAMGRPTTDPATALAGSLLPAGGQKGANIALLAEILSAALSGSALSMGASPLSAPEGGPPRLGQFVLVLDPGRFSPLFAVAMTTLAAQIAALGLRLPGTRTPHDQASLPALLWQQALALTGSMR
ncbi:MAG: Ldh family oxidoreductase [Gemmobacter sp.]|jgi:(2R)-3-sulfolactate dehydrogenase (NADP+)|nr:Ldh family oxidoreductase [Gemmobacter sp.]